MRASSGKVLLAAWLLVSCSPGGGFSCQAKTSVGSQFGPDWQVQAPTVASGSLLTSVWGSGPNDVWAVGWAGAMAHFDGTQWNAVAPVTSSDLLAVWGTGPRDVWAAGQRGHLFHFNGSSWQHGSVATVADLLAGWSSGPNDAWVVGEATLAHWNGAVWQSNAMAGSSALRAVWGSSKTDVWAAGGGTLWHFDGVRWSVRADVTDDLTVLWGSGPNDVWAGTSIDGRMLHFDGERWSSVNGPNARAVYGLSATDVWAVTDLALWHFGGDRWARVAATPDTVAGVWASAGGPVWSVGFTIASFDGTTWHPQLSQSDLNSIWGSTETDLWAVGSMGAMLHSDGSHWVPVNSLSSTSLNATFGCQADDVWAVGERAALHFDGTQWNVASSLPNWVYDGACVGGEVWVVGDHGMLARFASSAWNVFDTPVTSALLHVWGSSKTDVWAVGEAGALVHFDGVRWSAFSSGTSNTLRSVWGSGANDVWAVGDGDTVLRWKGSRWEKLVLPLSAGDLRDVTGNSAGEVWLLGPTQLLHAQGETWQAVRDLQATQLSALWSSPSHLYAVGQGGLVVRHR